MGIAALTARLRIVGSSRRHFASGRHSWTPGRVARCGFESLYSMWEMLILSQGAREIIRTAPCDPIRAPVPELVESFLPRSQSETQGLARIVVKSPKIPHDSIVDFQSTIRQP